MLDLVYEEPMCILVVVPSVDTRYGIVFLILYLHVVYPLDLSYLS